MNWEVVNKLNDLEYSVDSLNKYDLDNLSKEALTELLGYLVETVTLQKELLNFLLKKDYVDS